MDKPEISVVMSLYNSEKYLREAMDSVLAQTFTNFEFIIIDDGSKDGCESIVLSYNNSRIRFIKQENKGLPAALNKAISVAESDYIARMDPDDICLPERLEKQYHYLQEHDEVALVGCSAIYITEDGDEIAVVQKQSYIEKEAMTMPESPCIHPSVMFRKKSYELAQGYPEMMKCGGEDAVLFNRIILSSPIANLQDVLLRYRLSPHSMSQRSAYFNKLLRQMVCKQILNQPVPQNEWDILRQAYQKKTGGEFDYCLSVGKLFLFKRGKEKVARGHFYAVMQIHPLSPKLWLFWLASYMPFAWREMLKSHMQGAKEEVFHE